MREKKSNDHTLYGEL